MSCFRHNTINIVTQSVAKSSDEKSCLLANTTTKFFHYQAQVREELMLSCCLFQIPSEALTVIEIDTKTATHLPIIDIAPGDIWTTHKEFGVQLGEVCFS
ncbi:hypothetical protein EB796_008891 [Bugula neritina]|uniref:Fibrillar collagen NC1 domain-containing protein n=1 Tax=Bugula neritina TaxID=10212 RepID=A0A7J7K2E1_BUGNE|nr:hypothetical protein EB796_009676 [Bugula neritina]KAF6032799.1 hypothetical protein EB796_008891 [Bugula neritina]